MNTTTPSATSVPATQAMVPPSVRSIAAPHVRCAQSRGYELEDVDGLHLLGETLRPHALLEHDQAVRATARHLRRPCLRHRQLLDAPVIHALPHLLFHPHAAAAGAAAEAALAVMRGDLPPLDARDRVEDRPRLVVDPVVASEVAGIVIRDDVFRRIAAQDDP